MKTTRFRLLTVFLTIVMLLALNLNVYAAQSKAVTWDGITAQLFTDKNAYKAGEKVNANVQVTNNTGYEIFVLTQIKIPEGMTLASGDAAQDALLADGGVFNTSQAIVSAGNAVAGVTSTGDNMQAGFWIILSALGICSIVAMFVYGKNKKTWLSMFLCMAMVGGLMVSTVPAKAADRSGDIELSCTIQVDGKDTEVIATVSYAIYEEAEGAETPVATEAPVVTPEPTIEPTATPEPTVEPTATPDPTIAPTVAPTATPNPDALVLHVSVGGQAVDGCSAETHYADVEAAKTALRSMDHSNRSVEVLIHAGTYQFNEKVSFGAADSGTEEYPVVYKAAGDGDVYFTGSTKLDATKFTAVSDDVKERLPESARDKIVEISLAEYGITKDSLDLSKRYTGGNNPLGISYLYVNGVQQDMSRYPNTGYEKVMNVLAAGDKWTDDKGARAVFTFDSSAPYRWTTADQALIVGYLGNEWCRDWIPMGNVDVTAGTITLAAGTSYGIVNGATWFVTNLLEEIDLPGEFFIDANTLKLYWYPTEELSAEDQVELTVYDNLLVELLDVNYMEMNGIHFQHTLSDALKIGSTEKNSSNITIRNCTFNDCESSAITIYGKNNLVEACTFYECGLNTLELNGGGDPVTYTESKNRVANNHFWNVARQGAMLSKSAIFLGRNAYNRVISDVVENNIIHGHADGNGITYGGLDNVIRYNEIYSLAQNLSDAGLVYAGRKLSEFGNVIEYNYFHDFGSNFSSDQRVQAFYWDDTQSGQTARHNIIVPNNLSNGAGNLANGAYNTITENIVANAFIGVHMSTKKTAVADTAYNNLWSTTYCTDAVRAKYPQLEEFRAFLVKGEPLPARYNVMTNNLSVNVGQNTVADEVKQWGTIENNQIIDDLSVFVDPDNHDYRLKAEAVTTLGLPNTFINETNFSMNSIGIQTHVFAIETPESEFKLLYPEEGESVQVTQVFLKWEKAQFADEYEYVVATDREMTNVVASGTTYDKVVKIEGLTKGQTYYYTVQAKNLSKQIGNSWANAGGARSFTVSATEMLDVTALNAQIATLEAFENTLVIGTNPGEFKAEVSAAIADILGRAKDIAALQEGEQETVDAMTAELIRFINGINGYKNVGYVDFIDLSKAGAKWEAYLGKNDTKYITASDTEEGGVILDVIGNASAYLDKQLSNSEINRFKMRVSYTDGSSSYMSLALRHKDLEKHAYSTQHAYCVIIKADKFELQKYPKTNGTSIVKTAENNGIFEVGKWHDVEFGAVDVVDGVQVTFKVDGVEVLSWVDEANPLYGTGYFSIYTGGNKAVVELLPYNHTEEPENPMTPKQDQTEVIPDGVYYENAFDNAEALLNDKYLDRESGLNDSANKIQMYATNSGISRLNMQIGSKATVRSLYADAVFDEPVDCNGMIIQVRLQQNSTEGKRATIQVQYPYASSTDSDGGVTYSMNTLLTLDQSQNWTVGKENYQVGNGLYGEFEFRINFANGIYTVWHKASEDVDYTQLTAVVNEEIIDTFSINPAEGEFTPGFVRIQTDDLEEPDGKECRSFVNNFKVFKYDIPEEPSEPQEPTTVYYYAANFDDLESNATPESLNPVDDDSKVKAYSYHSNSGAKSVRLVVGKASVNRWLYVQPAFNKEISSDDMIIELRINRSANKVSKVVLQYPYAKTVGSDDSVAYSWNDLITMEEGNEGIWKLGKETDSVGSGSGSYLFAFKVNLKTGICTAYKKTGVDDTYEQLGESFQVEPLTEGFSPEFVKLYVEKMDTSAEGITTIDNFAIYSGTEFIANDQIPWNQ